MIGTASHLNPAIASFAAKAAPTGRTLHSDSSRLPHE
ncbi:hypothetical protein B597_009160 [Stutzerimonas stutzeri KOS6]|uniref:Uncharacterized protein n=1 Tax=Stutzerimonas stutzeri KOS6 TaxID=1218352 RepID=A0A061JPD1_STUST|nr:hypothetical protein B597_009160 [Stutzerimonas stutzeri KOS6]